MTTQRLTGPQIAEARLDGWTNLIGGLQTRIHTPDFATGLALVNAIGAAAEEAGHHPDLDLRFAHLDVRLSSHDVGGVTERDIDLARTISGLVADAAAGAEITMECATVSRLELALDTPAHERVLPFWRAVLAMEDPASSDVDDEVRDPYGALPTVWFQRSTRDEPRQHWHLDVWVEPSEVQTRIDAAVAAGGTLVSDAEAPSFWVLSDPEGNKVCFCTWQDRG